MLNKDEIYRVLSEGDSQEKLNLLQYLPENTMKGTVKNLITSNDPVMTLLGFGSLLPHYCFGANCTTGQMLGLALYRYGKGLFLSGKYPNLYLYTVIGFANNYITALINISRFEEADNFIESELIFWKEYECNINNFNSNDVASFLDNLKSILISRINILLQLNRIDEAWDLAFNDPKIEGNPAADIELQRLRKNLLEIRKKVINLDIDKSQRDDNSLQNQKESTKTILNSVKKIVSQTGIDPSIFNSVENSENLNPNLRTEFNQLEDILNRGESYLQKDSSELNEISIRQQIRRASGIFVDNKPHRDEIMNSLNSLKQSLKSAQKIKNSILINDAYYGLSLCYSRLNESSKAADQLINLRKNLETVRNGIKNPLDRGGVFQKYPYLFYSSVDHMYKSHRFDDILDAIEGSKGRTITDTLEAESSMELREPNLYNIRERLFPMLKKYNANYVSFHVDDNYSYVCIVLKSGYIHAAQIPVGKEELNKYYRKNIHNPSSWNLQLRKINIIEELHPFILPVENLISQGLIKKGDHFCYSADHLLYLFPLHYLKINGKSLIELFTVSRVHNAGHLLYLLNKPTVRLQSCLAIEVPSSEDINNSELNNAFGLSASNLQKIYSSNFNHLNHYKASLKNVLSGFKKKQLIHFSTHGFFPYEDNPFNSSGLLLSDNNLLPTLHKQDPNYKYRDEGLHLLNPERLLTDKHDLSESHISLEACVAGYAREGIGGDALGIEWAFFQKGASSLTSTFWSVDINNANEFYKHFYHEWLTRKSSKAVAHQHAILKLKNSSHGTNLPDEYFWAGYGLIGDWR